jgi:CubicO group peptidase (beta-lactamase class C family)
MGTSTAKTSVIMLLALGVALMVAPSVTGLPAGDNQFSDQVNRLFTERITSSTPGAAVVVTKAGKPVLKRCYGLADLEHGVPVTAGTAFNLASAAKQFTAFSILLLEQKGRIDLDDDVHKYLPELPAYSQPVTIRHLLNNTSGIWEYYSTMTYYCGYDLQDHFTLKEIMELLQHQEALLFEPGSQWSYCNTNYVLLAQIVQRITGVPFQQWTKSNIFYPTGERTFATRSRSNSVEFFDGEDGTCDRAEVSVRDDKYTARRIILDAKEVEARVADYAGDYYSPTFEVVYGCRVENGRLFMHHRRYGSMPMQPIDEEEFLFVLGFVHFNRGPDGEVVGFTLIPSDEDFHFQTIEFIKVSSPQ